MGTPAETGVPIFVSARYFEGVLIDYDGVLRGLARKTQKE
jgi:hypothetical protein